MPNQNATLLQRFYLLPLVGPERRDGEPLCCLFTQNQVVEVLGRAPVYPIPFCPPWLRGCIRHSGGLAPLVDVDILCGPGKKAARPAPIRQILVLRTGREDAAGGQFLKLALACADTVLTFRLTERDVAAKVTADEAPKNFDGRGLAQGFFRLREHRVVLMNFDAIAAGEFDAAKDG